MKVALIANPKSGRNAGLIAARIAQEQFEHAGWDAPIRCTRCAGDATRLAREAAAEGVDVVFACGGDGSLSDVITGLLDTGVPGGLIPAGTGNDFGRYLGLSLNPWRAAAQLLNGRPEGFDMLEVNAGQTWAVNVIGVGLDARVAERINRRNRLIGGAWAYIIGLARELIDYPPAQVHLTFDDQVWTGRIILLAIANAVSYGGGMKIAPNSRIDDGLMDIIAVEYMSRLEFIRTFPKVFSGTHLSHPQVHHWQARRARIITDTPAPVLIDGDVTCHTPLDVQIAPGKGLLWMPPGASTGEHAT